MAQRHCPACTRREKWRASASTAPTVWVQTHCLSFSFNPELLAALELGFMLDVGSAIVESALHRTESRGAHQRTDFPARDDRNFLAHTLIFRNPDGSTRVEQAAVVITRWPPGERVYGVQSEVKEVAAR